MSQPQQSVADLKTLVISRIEAFMFEIALSLYRGNTTVAFNGLYALLPLLPPDIRRDISSQEQELKSYKMTVSTTRGADYFQTVTNQRRAIYSKNEKIRQILGDIQKLLYDRYLRMGYRGINVNDQLQFLNEGDPDEDTLG